MYQIYQSDVLDWAREYQGEPFHAALMDPPYHLTSITKRFGKADSKPAKGDVYNRASKGFMGSRWDGGDIAFNPETWAALAQHLYPGAFGMAFASSRGWHRMAVAIEDAGLIIHPSIFGWAYLSGFPKATRIKGYGSPAFKGYRYGLQALKPALEPIIVFQRPYEGRPVDSIVVTGAGALNVDGGRISTNDKLDGGGYMTPVGEGWDRPWRHNEDIRDEKERIKDERVAHAQELGRWPANFTLTHSPDCNGTCVPDCPVRLLDEQSGNRQGGSAKTGLEPSELTKNTYGKRNPVAFAGYDDDGPASRMFHRADFTYEIAEQLANADPVRYEPKAGTSEREAGLAELEAKTRHRVNSGGLENEPRFAPTQAKNHHPTVKPISLTKYLGTLLLPPAAYAPRRILCPFSGVSSEMIGCLLAGWDEVIGIEKTAQYIPIAEARLRWWSQWPGWGQTDVDKILAAVAKKEAESQLSLF